MRRDMNNKKWFFAATACFFVSFLVFWSVKAYVGDINFDNLINQNDIDIITMAFGSNDWSGNPAWNPTADLNEDDKIDIKDLAIAGRNYGSQRTFHQGRNFSNSDNSVYKLDACLDGKDQIHIAWSDSDKPGCFLHSLRSLWEHNY